MEGKVALGAVTRSPLLIDEPAAAAASVEGEVDVLVSTIIHRVLLPRSLLEHSVYVLLTALRIAYVDYVDPSYVGRAKLWQSRKTSSLKPWPFINEGCIEWAAPSDIIRVVRSAANLIICQISYDGIVQSG
jgi:hypothetical protein